MPSVDLEPHPIDGHDSVERRSQDHGGRQIIKIVEEDTDPHFEIDIENGRLLPYGGVIDDDMDCNMEIAESRKWHFYVRSVLPTSWFNRTTKTLWFNVTASFIPFECSPHLRYPWSFTYRFLNPTWNKESGALVLTRFNVQDQRQTKNEFYFYIPNEFIDMVDSIYALTQTALIDELPVFTNTPDNLKLH